MGRLLSSTLLAALGITTAAAIVELRSNSENYFRSYGCVVEDIAQRFALPIHKMRSNHNKLENLVAELDLNMQSPSKNFQPRYLIKVYDAIPVSGDVIKLRKEEDIVSYLRNIGANYIKIFEIDKPSNNPKTIPTAGISLDFIQKVSSITFSFDGQYLECVEPGNMHLFASLNAAYLVEKALVHITAVRLYRDYGELTPYIWYLSDGRLETK